MILKFFGRGAGFSNLMEGHTSAYFETENNDLVILDLPMSSFYKLKEMDLKKYNNLFVFITHTHGDHISGLGLFAQLTFFTLGKKIKIIVPQEIKQDIRTILSIEGNDPNWYFVEITDSFKHTYCKSWFKSEIGTVHSPQLENKCFGYLFNINGKNIIYTGDTSTLSPFKKYFSENMELYVDTSVHYGQIHLKLEDIINDESLKDFDVYLMHLDDVNAAKKIVEDIKNIKVVEL